MTSAPPSRKKSPRAPSLSLDEALERAIKAYEKDRLVPASTEIVAQHIGYKSASNGAALSALASLRYYGLLNRPSEGMLAVTRDVEDYKFAPSDELRRALLATFLRRPPLFAELLDKYPSELPSDAELKYELIHRGFIPSSAATMVGVIKRSVRFAAASHSPTDILQTENATGAADHADLAAKLIDDIEPRWPLHVAEPATSRYALPTPARGGGQDTIPVRLSGGRRAWLVIPTPLFEADKQRLKAQIELLLTDDVQADG